MKSINKGSAEGNTISGGDVVKKKKIKVENVGKNMRSVRFDPMGSYTGNTKKNEKPEQDADDL